MATTVMWLVLLAYIHHEMNSWDSHKEGCMGLYTAAAGTAAVTRIRITPYTEHIRLS